MSTPCTTGVRPTSTWTSRSARCATTAGSSGSSRTPATLARTALGEHAAAKEDLERAERLAPDHPVRGRDADAADEASGGRREGDETD